MSNLRPVTVCEDVEGLPRRVQAGQAGGLRGDGPPALERRLQRGGPVGDHAQRLAPHRHHLSPLRPWLVGVRLLDCRGQKGRRVSLADWPGGTRQHSGTGETL